MKSTMMIYLHTNNTNYIIYLNPCENWRDQNTYIVKFWLQKLSCHLKGTVTTKISWTHFLHYQSLIYHWVMYTIDYTDYNTTCLQHNNAFLRHSITAHVVLSLNILPIVLNTMSWIRKLIFKIIFNHITLKNYQLTLITKILIKFIV